MGRHVFLEGLKHVGLIATYVNIGSEIFDSIFYLELSEGGLLL